MRSVNQLQTHDDDFSNDNISSHLMPSSFDDTNQQIPQSLSSLLRSPSTISATHSFGVGLSPMHPSQRRVLDEPSSPTRTSKRNHVAECKLANDLADDLNLTSGNRAKLEQIAEVGPKQSISDLTNISFAA
jgi:hypothetical protein